MDDNKLQELITACLAAKEKAYAPYSKFSVGAALLTKEGRIYSGCNVENCSYPMCTCAERCAVVKAVSEGYKEFTAIAVSGKSQTSNSDEGFVSPCGNCRQILAEFGLDTQVIMTKSDRTCEMSTMRELLPKAFISENLKDK